MTGLAAIVLAGGRSTRMGTPKEALDWGGVSLVEHMARTVAQAVDGPVVVVRDAGRELPPLPAGVEVAVDRLDGRGPLAGIAAGLLAVEGRAPAAFVTAVDLPLLRPELVRFVAAALRPEDDAAVPEAHGRAHPLAAVYRVGVRSAAEELLGAGRNRVLDLVEAVRARRLSEAELLSDPALAAADPRLESLRNLNSRTDYESALALAPSSESSRPG